MTQQNLDICQKAAKKFQNAKNLCNYKHLKQDNVKAKSHRINNMYNF